MEGRELPVGWATAQVGEVCRLLNGRAYGKSELLETGKYRVLRVGNLFTNPRWYHSDLELDEDKYCQAGDLLYAWSASFGPHVWEGEKVIYHYHIWKVEHDVNLIHRDFLKVFFHWDTNRIKQQQGSGSTMLHVTKKSMEERAIPVPPTSEQRRIAAKLDTTLAAVDACRQRLDGVAAILKRFRQAVLAAATSGKLTREWPSDFLWKECSITDVCEVVRGASPRPAGDPRFFGGMGTIPWITVGELTKDSDKYLLSTSCFLTEAGMAKSRCIMPGTLLLTNSGVTLGVPKISLIEGCINDGSVALLGLEEPLKSYIYYVLRSKTQDLRSINQGAAQPNLNTSIVKAISFMLPDSSMEQSEVVRRIEELFTLADQLEARLTAARKVVDRLTPALLAKAFRGELVPQDPNDEPASVLLERIRAARQAEAGASKPSRRGRPKAAANPDQLPLDAAPAPSEPLPPNLLTQLLQECGALSERALLAASELEPEGFFTQLERELRLGSIRQSREEGQVLLEAVS